MACKRKVLTYLIILMIVIVSGLSTRHFAEHLPWWVNVYVGDGLWALMIFLITGLIFRRKDTSFVAVVALSFCYFIEISQLYHSPWIDALRITRLGRLILGQGFLWSDILSYSVGIGTGFLFEKIYLKNCPA